MQRSISKLSLWQNNLGGLNYLCEQAGVWVGVESDQLDLLSEYAVRVRYPGDDPTAEEAREALDIAKAVRQFARRWLGV